MEASTFVKTATLSTFLLLLSGFVAYRAGLFNGFSEHTTTTSVPAALASDADEQASLVTIDSPPPKMTIFPGSKSGIILNERDQVTLLTDTAMSMQKWEQPVAVDSTHEALQLMPGSKQAPPFPPPAGTGKKTKRNKQKQ